MKCVESDEFVRVNYGRPRSIFPFQFPQARGIEALLSPQVKLVLLLFRGIRSQVSRPLVTPSPGVDEIVRTPFRDVHSKFSVHVEYWSGVGYAQGIDGHNYASERHYRVVIGEPFWEDNVVVFDQEASRKGERIVGIALD